MSQNADLIHVKELQLPHGLVAPDVWGKPKEQPATISLTVSLQGDGFSTAADKDQLDQSTIHYGELSKRLRSLNHAGQDVESFAEQAHKCVHAMAGKAEGKFIVRLAALRVTLPKASMYGEGCVCTRVVEYDDGGEVTRRMGEFGLNEVKIMTLVGVNAYERQAEQPLLIGVHVTRWVQQSEGVMEWPKMEEMAGLEGKVAEIVKPTSFETLETLADHTARLLQEEFLATRFPQGCILRLTISKPRAIPFADAPAVEVMRNSHENLRGGVNGESAPTISVRDLSVVKPYA
ncbi:hypothetical protein KC332_g2090 [Hortaea werneckii]|uniref:dihydroneopterin aldolase n=1 Tax=Hortaea werneckii TaxID=91943 RepID=A0A3M7J6H0_HORWE|nr:hypothetical protein KC329_g13657 [Hortaea werneckii]KAI7255692.1 hypothetical protein KC335_g13712 [Hortaea werneckii]KAI7413536.1 hypothetical protein KC336_g11357 [Hortaea werneckii]KAI7418106.1 hypothetical protein KC332_g2090 [Hortaea werneckii]KAI7451974.1 hypothetical protein KC368_g3570 [Hortaea werneckii]